jgi:Putative beta barrel porin-7 (BBP7)
VQVLRGGVYDNESRAGGRISLWIWLDQSRRSALTFRYWNAGDINGSAVFNSSDFPTQVLGRPVFNTDPGTNAADFVAVGEPNALTGLLQINTRSQVYGMNFEVERMFYADRFTRVHWVYGYNSFSLKESLQINSTTTDIDATSLTFNHVFRVSDTFRTANRLDGFSLGFRSKRRIAAFQLETLVRLTSGNLRRQVFIQGSTSDTDGAGNTTSQTEGVLARATNARDLVSNTFVLSPEAGINLGYALSANLDFSIGYNYLMVPKVAQASRQLNSDLRTNLSNPISGPQDPAFRFHNKNYWVRSLGLGVQYRY